jgi:translocation and assembly module TamB
MTAEASSTSRRWDLGRTLARVLCVVLGAIGLLPVAAVLLVSSPLAQRWAEEQTRVLLARELGVTATYKVGVRLLPLRLVVSDLQVPGSDGKGPALTVESISASPRVFSLLAGKLDLGDIELQKPRARIVLVDGKPTNVRYKLPERDTKPQKSSDIPFFTLAISEGRFDLDVDGMLIETGPVDLDVFAEQKDVFEVALHASKSVVRRRREERTVGIPSSGTTVTDDDVFCRVEARLRAEKEQVLVRRFSVLGVLDDDPAAGAAPSCDKAEEHVRQVAVRLSQVRVVPRKDALPLISGHVVVRAPLGITNRFVKTLPFNGWAALSGEVAYDGSERLPRLNGKITGAGVQFERYKLAKLLDVDLRIEDEVIHVPHYYMNFADGDVYLKNARIDPFAPGGRLDVESVEGKGMQFSGLMRDLGVTPNTIIWWDLNKTNVRKIGGSFAPLKIDAEITAETRDFEVFDRAFHDKGRRHMIGVKQALVRGRLGVRANSFDIYDTRTDFGKSNMYVELVSIGFDNTIRLIVPPKRSKLDLADITPLVDISMAGQAEIDADMAGPMGDPLLQGNVKIAGFEFGGFPLGDIKSGKVRFKPLWLELENMEAQKGRSAYRVPSAKLDFDAGATVLVDAQMTSESFDIRDFFGMWHFDKDPRWNEVKGETAVSARVHYVLGGKQDTCGGGLLETSGKISLHRAELFEERYDGGEAEFDFRWFDRDATYHGMEMHVPALTLRKGSGLIIGSLDVTRGAKVSGRLVASSVPLAKLDALPAMLKSADGRASAEAEISGSLDMMQIAARARLSPVQVGRSMLPASEIDLKLVPIAVPRPVVRFTKPCGGPVTPPYDRGEYDADRSSGDFHLNGKLFGGQIRLDDVRISRQRNKVVRGNVVFTDFDVGAAGELSSAVALSDARIDGRASGRIELEELFMAEPLSSKVKVSLTSLNLSRAGYSAELLPSPKPITLAERRLNLGGLGLGVVTPTGHRVSVDLAGNIERLDGAPELDASLSLRPVALASLVGVVPRVERASGTVDGSLRLRGPLSAPRYSGGFALSRGELVIRGLHAPLTDIDVALGIDGSELSITRGSAKFGSGRLSLSGGAPLRGFALGAARFRLKAQDMALPLGEGIRAVADADLTTVWEPGKGTEQKLPRITGDVLLRSFEYRRPVTMTADIASLTQRGRRTSFEAYDPADEAVAFDITLRAARTLKLQNNLIEAELKLGDEGLVLVGTNSRYGLRGTVELAQGGRIRLRRSEFEVTQGTVRFDDATRIAPQVDVTAVTEYRRYTEADSGSVAAQPTSSSSVAGGNWKIRMHAHGDADNLKIDLTSDPVLAQDDIFLLLTVGLTRAELDQARSAAVGESVALEALGTLSGADKAVTEAVPLIDDFRFGSAYSSRTGRTEPTVTIGKRLAERVRANVTTGLSESREVRSNVEWRLSPRVSVEGSYDNVNDISSSSLGNLGADIRWRMEFE